MKKLYLALVLISSLTLSFGCCTKSTTEITKPSYQDLHDHLNQSTVALVDESDSGELYVYCSGVWVDEYHFVTAHHCVSDDDDQARIGQAVRYSTYNDLELTVPPTPPKKAYSAVVVDSRREADVALVKSFNDIPHHYADLDPNKKIYPGLDVLIVGHTNVLEYTHMKGVVSEVRQVSLPFTRWDSKMIHVTSLIYKGNSGGGMFDPDGNLIGICSFFHKGVSGLSFFAHRDEIIDLLREHKLGIVVPNL